MLIRIVDHFRDNPKRIDKLIAIKGLPNEWFFREGPEGLELKKPWEADIDKNIPHEIRHLCEPMYIIFRYSPLNNQAKEVIEKRQILGVKIDYNSEPGRQMWDDIERYVEETMPRSERIPVAVVCARDERSAFETHTPRRNARGSLELIPGPVPMVDLTKYVQMKTEDVVIPKALDVINNPDQATESMVSARPQQNSFKCDECDYIHHSPRGIRMHAVKRHPKQKVGV
jgi:hypothetical protein